MDDREFEEANELTQMRYLHVGLKQAFKYLKEYKEKIISLEARLAGLTAADGPGASKPQGATDRPEATSASRREDIQRQYPGFSRTSHISVFDKHVAVLRKKPTDAELRSIFEKGCPYPLKAKQFQARIGCTTKEAAAWLYLLRKKDWLNYCEITWTFEDNLEKNRPDSELSKH